MADEPTTIAQLATASKQPTTLDTFHARLTKELYNLKPDPLTGRLIDSHPGTRTKPMRVLCLGMSRTGTMSLFTALQKLGYAPYHMAVAMGSPRTNLDCWSEGLNAKFNGRGKKWGKEEFDKLLGNYDAVADVPCIAFVEELVAAYPDAKVVLSTRDVDGWVKSMQSTAGKILAWNWEWLAPWDPSLVRPFWDHAKVVMPAAFRVPGQSPDFVSPDSQARQAFADHYDLVRRVVPKERLLEYRVQEGWQPLCDFLDAEVPGEEYPRVNDASQFIVAHHIMWTLAFGKMVGKIALMGVLPLAGVAAAAWWQWRR
ncbi:Uu.00g001460.m01.CDS01 [Anthostomella pinea]|uniref:Uu.00g001460.m01.CDS01 n=1 Tax=Anthostomella pinea TaxID=933095 RepID=A0AAI8YIJ0_9PEZI|nr:Uu.00g001460.m01.CDS01 [Anthostomella pinea]